MEYTVEIKKGIPFEKKKRSSGRSVGRPRVHVWAETMKVGECAIFKSSPDNFERLVINIRASAMLLAKRLKRKFATRTEKSKAELRVWRIG